MAEGYSNRFVQPPSKDLRWKCHICQGILRTPVLVSCCGGKFCHVCISRWRGQNKLECPLCRRKYSFEREKELERTLLDKEVLCLYHDQGCQWRGELRKVEEHEKDDCQYVFVDCPYKCDEKVQRLNVELHEGKCPKRPQPCEFAAYGCRKMIPFGKTEVHRKSHSQHHLTLVLSELKKREVELQVAKEDMASHQTKLCHMEEHVRDAEEHCRITEAVLQQTKEKLYTEKERCKKIDDCLKQAKGELKKAKKDVLDCQKRLQKEKEYCRVTEEALQEAERELYIKQERCRKMGRDLDQTTKELRRARSSLVATENRLHEKEEDCRRAVETVQVTTAKLHLEQQRCKQNEEKLQAARWLNGITQTKLQQAEHHFEEKEKDCRRVQKNLLQTLHLEQQRRREIENELQHTWGFLFLFLLFVSGFVVTICPLYGTLLVMPFYYALSIYLLESFS